MPPRDDRTVARRLGRYGGSRRLAAAAMVRDTGLRWAVRARDMNLRRGVVAGLLLAVILLGVGREGMARVLYDDEGTHGDHPVTFIGHGDAAALRPEGLDEDASWDIMVGAFLPCVVSGGPVTILGYSWSSPAGTQPENVTAFAHWIDPTVQSPFMGMDGTREDLADRSPSGTVVAVDIAGLEIDTECQEWPHETYEIVLEVQVGPAGAVLDDVTFLYATADGRVYEARNSSVFTACGTRTTQRCAVTESG